ncbi:hypothetical protein J4408_02755 [Candidatus Pacearchaeota archaeon]|nr:hypothetical protein [Candidatus Pacearchaeota archaeon]
MDLDECYKKNFIKKTRIDKELVQSLIEMSKIKEDSVKNAQVNETNISAYVSMAYDSLREILEALCILKGYKVTSHICLGELLKTLVSDFDFNSFDRFRYVRNGINYYGTKVDYQQGKEIILKMFKLKSEIINNHLKDI